jgi:hypothetical protein
MDALDAKSEWFLTHSPRLWGEKLPEGRANRIRIVAGVLELVLPEWRAAHPDDTIPPRAVQAALANPDGADDGLRRHAWVLAKGCSRSRKNSLGCEHRIAEAARALATAAAVASESAAMKAIGEALDKVEEHLLYRLAVAGVYDQEAKARDIMLQKAIESRMPNT